MNRAETAPRKKLLLLWLIWDEYQRAFHVVKCSGWKKPLQHKCLLSGHFPLRLSITYFQIRQRGKRLEVIRLIIAFTSLILSKGECQRKTFLPQKLQKRALATPHLTAFLLLVRQCSHTAPQQQPRPPAVS